MKQLIIIAILLTTLLSCDNDDTDSFINEDIKNYNDRISNGHLNKEQWTVDPILIVRELFKSDDFERKIIIDFEGKSKDEIVITLTREGLEDDSVDGEKRIIEFEKENNLWTIRTIKLGFKCWKSRGHTNYSGDLCS
jgi:hypothetical protein